LGTAGPTYWNLGSLQGMGWHGRATLSTGHAIAGTGHVVAGTGRAKLLASQAQNFFSRFLESCSDNFLQNNLKQTSNKIKAIKYVGGLPRSARLESLA